VNLITLTMRKQHSLSDALLSLNSAKEVDHFLRDLCTPAEIRELEQRWEICQLLHAGQLSYREIAEKVKTSVTTVTRVARFLRDEPYQGYASVLKRLK
jgi:TrpR-related protein YerC/YecD